MEIVNRKAMGGVNLHELQFDLLEAISDGSSEPVSLFQFFVFSAGTLGIFVQCLDLEELLTLQVQLGISHSVLVLQMLD